MLEDITKINTQEPSIIIEENSIEEYKEKRTVKEYDEDRRSWAKREEYRGRPDKKSGNSVRSGGYQRSNLSGRSEATHNEECTERTKK